MLTNKNSARFKPWAISSVLAFATLLLAGCQPAGPKALLLGERYIGQGEYEKALKQLTRASELIPEHPQVWNHLGLAYHGLGQPVKAAEAYQRALRIDRNLPAPRYNLGLLYLEQSHIPQAAAELSAYVSGQTNSAIGYVKLATALLRMKRPDDADRVLIHALRLDAKDPEAHNLLGLAHVQRKRPREAMQAFNNALQVSPTYAPAVLNQAVVAHSYFANRELALERYRAFLTTEPDQKTSARVQHAIRLIEREIAGPEIAVTPTPPSTHAETNQVSGLAKTNLASQTASKTNVQDVVTPATAATNIAAVATAKTNVPPAVTSTNIETVVKQPAKTNVVAATPQPPKTNVTVAVSTNQTASTAETTQAPPDETPIPVEVVRLEEPEFKAPRDIADTKVAIAQPRPAIPQEVPETKPLLIPRKDRKEEEKSGVLSRVNPMRWFRNDESDSQRSATKAATPAPRPSYPPVVREIAPTPEAPRVIPRYPYRKKAPLVAGNRAQAEKVFRIAAQAHQQRRLPEAIENYRQATLLDPTYFEAHYNLALAAYQNKNLPLALAENELAVTADPKSNDARYNFALTLREANYPADAASELRTIVASEPDDVRAHFSLANLYAQQLDEPVLARTHYLAVLELNPAHPDAPAIRHWLANNP